MTENSPWFCECKEKVYVTRTIKNGTKQYGTQCRRCGSFVCMKRSAIPLNETLEEYDADLRAAFSQEAAELARVQYSQERQQKTAEWFAWYSEYLQTPKWAEKRDRVLRRDFHLCQACLRRKATVVHHKTYAHVFDEPLFDLISMCHECHDFLTQLDRERRA
jgi:5-methylcytosine-specific restriction endonuclease McrA